MSLDLHLNESGKRNLNSEKTLTLQMLWPLSCTTFNAGALNILLFPYASLCIILSASVGSFKAYSIFLAIFFYMHDIK